VCLCGFYPVKLGRPRVGEAGCDGAPLPPVLPPPGWSSTSCAPPTDANPNDTVVAAIAATIPAKRRLRMGLLPSVQVFLLRPREAEASTSTEQVTSPVKAAWCCRHVCGSRMWFSICQRYSPAHPRWPMPGSDRGRACEPDDRYVALRSARASCRACARRANASARSSVVTWNRGGCGAGAARVVRANRRRLLRSPTG
jgi:hypothetical protein